MANVSTGTCVIELVRNPDMSEHPDMELSTRERELILEGLRYVRSSRRFEFREPLAPPDPRRENDLKDIAELTNRLEGAVPAAEAKV
jgi:hypothetical protein